MNQEQVTVEQFQQLLDSHDWNYDYSDDMNVYRKGAEQSTIINNIMKGRPELETLYSEVYARWK